MEQRSSGSPESGYLFGDVEFDLETHRLDLLEALQDPETFERLRRLPVRRGDRCLEVGAGAGSVAIFLAASCGVQGEVVATDVDTRWLDQLAHPRLRTLRHDLVKDDVTALGTFDVIHARLVLTQLGAEQGELALERLVSILRPGGRILIEDLLVINAADPQHPRAADIEEENAIWYNQLAPKFGVDLRFGLRVPQILSNVGLTAVASELSGPVTRGGDLYRQWVEANTRSVGSKVDLNSVYRRGVDAVIDMQRDPTLWICFQAVVATSATRSS
ncbi:MAG: class I SAM-dependent methyltransferase [Acidimicrobiia bacterium]